MAKAKEATTKKQTDRFTVAEVREQLLATMIKNNQDIIQCVANTEQMLEELNDIKTKMAILEEEQAANKASIEKQAAKLDSFVETEAEVSTKVDTLSATLVDHIDKYDSNVKANLEDKAEQLKACLANRLKDYNVEIEESFAQIGSGSQPMATIPSIAVTIAEKTEAKLTALLAIFKALEQPIIGRVEKGKIWLDLRSVADFKALLDTVEKL